MNAPTAVRNTRLLPKRSPSHPEAGTNTAMLMRYAVTTHCTDGMDTEKSWASRGRATFTIWESMMLMNMATA